MRKGSAKAQATVRIGFRTMKQTNAIAAALKPELWHPAGNKAGARIRVHGRKLVLEFEARDSATLRAIMSSYLRMLGASLNVSESLIQLEKSNLSQESNKKAN